jgi:hypothetical protein
MKAVAISSRKITTPSSHTISRGALYDPKYRPRNMWM